MRTVFWILITDIAKLNYNRIPAILFETNKERNEYIDKYEPMSYRIFEYEIEEEYAILDINEWKPLIFPNL